MKAITVGFYALRGTSVREFTADSKTESFVGFLILYSQGQESARGSRRHGDISDVSAAIFPRSQSNRVYLEGHKEGRSVSFVKYLDNLKQIVGHTFDCLSKRLNFAKSWVDKFLSRFPFAMEDYALNYNHTMSVTYVSQPPH